MTVSVSELLPLAAEVEVGRGKLKLQSLTLAALAKLIRDYREPLSALFDTARSGSPDYSKILDSAPDLVAEMIALSADAVGQEESIKKIPGAVQLIAVGEIWRLSVPDVKKLNESLSLVAGWIKESPEQGPTPAPSLTSSSDSLNT